MLLFTFLNTSVFLSPKQVKLDAKVVNKTLKSAFFLIF